MSTFVEEHADYAHLHLDDFAVGPGRIGLQPFDELRDRRKRQRRPIAQLQATCRRCFDLREMLVGHSRSVGVLDRSDLRNNVRPHHIRIHAPQRLRTGTTK